MQKVANFTYPMCVWPVDGDRVGISLRRFGARKAESVRYRTALLRVNVHSSFDRTATCGRRADRQTDGRTLSRHVLR